MATACDLIPLAEYQYAQPETVRERLCRKRRYYLEQLEKIEAGLSLLDENPNLEKLHDTLNAIR